MNKVANNLGRPSLFILLFDFAIVEEFIDFLKDDFVASVVGWRDGLTLLSPAFLHNGIEIFEVGVAVLMILHTAKHTRRPCQLVTVPTHGW